MFKILAGGVFDDEGGHFKRRMPHLYSMRESTSNPSSARLGSDGYAHVDCVAISRLGSSRRLMTTESDALAGCVHRRRPARSPSSLPARASRRIQRGRVSVSAVRRTTLSARGLAIPSLFVSERRASGRLVWQRQFIANSRKSWFPPSESTDDAISASLSRYRLPLPRTFARSSRTRLGPVGSSRHRNCDQHHQL